MLALERRVEGEMKLDPGGVEYFATSADHEGLRYRAPSIRQADRFSRRKDAEDAVLVTRQIRALQSYEFYIIGVEE